MEEIYNVTISQERYEELIRAEAKLEALCRMIIQDKPYYYKTYQIVVDKDLLPDITEETK